MTAPAARLSVEYSERGFWRALIPAFEGNAAVRHVSASRFGAVLISLFTVSLAHAAADAPRVIIISLDGLRPDAISQEASPTIERLCQQGACSMHAACDLPSATLTNHATMITSKLAKQHGVVVDFELPGTLRTRTIFHVLRDAGLRSAFFASKEKLRYLAPLDALETIVINPQTEPLVDQALTQITTDGPDLFFIHLKDPDSTGHRDGWMTPEYLAALTRMDALVGKLVDAAAADQTRPTYFIVTADHGGGGKTHVLNLEEVRRVPFILYGPDIPPGVEINDEDISPVDVAPTALDLLNIDIPNSFEGRSRVMRVTGVDRLAVPIVGIPCFVFFMPLLGAAWLAFRNRDVN